MRFEKEMKEMEARNVGNNTTTKSDHSKYATSLAAKPQNRPRSKSESEPKRPRTNSDLNNEPMGYVFDNPIAAGSEGSFRMEIENASSKFAGKVYNCYMILLG